MISAPPGAGDFTWQVSNVMGTRPAAAFGTTVTPGNNSKGSYAQVLTGITFEAWAVAINFNSGATAGAARDILVDIGIDPAGGTSYSVLIPDLLASCCTGLDVGIGITYWFPIVIPSGSTVAARASVNNGTVGTVSVIVTVFGKPRDPTKVWRGAVVDSFGITSSSSSGTAVTPGGASEGTWTSISTNLQKNYAWWQLGMGVNNATMTSGLIYFADLGYGDSSNKIILIQDQIFSTPNASETLMTPGVIDPCERYVQSGGDLWVRSQCSGAPDTGISYAAYGVR